MKDRPTQGDAEKVTTSLEKPRSWMAPAVAALSLLLFLHVFGLTAALNRSFYDLLQRSQADPASLDENAVLVLIDEPSIEQMSKNRGLRWPWPRDSFAALVAGLHQAGVKNIVLDLIFLEHSEDEMKDRLLASYAAACSSVILAEIPEKKQILWPQDFQKQYPEFNLGSRIAIVRHEPDPDGVLRRYNYDQSLAAEALDHPPAGVQLLRWPSNLKDLAQKYPQRVLSAYPWIEFGRTVLAAATEKIGDAEFDPSSLAKILPDLPRPKDVDFLKGKTVFIGANVAAAYDTKATPLTPNEPGVMYHVAAWSNGKKNNGLHPAPFPELPVALLLCSLILYIGLHEKVSQERVILFGLALFFLLGGVSWILFLAKLWLQPADPAFGIIIGFGAVAVQNWRRERNRKRHVKALFGSYVSEKVLDNLLENPEAIKLGGERKQLTIYFSDLAGFTDMSEGMEPEELIEVVNTYLDEMSPFIIENGGYLDKYIGDAIMGVFGAPETLADPAAAACKAALESRDHLRELSARMLKERGTVLHARIGVNSGDIIVGNVGSKKKLSYTVMGDAVNLASRLEGANKEYGTTIMLGEKTAALLDDRFALRPIELLAVKGKKLPVQTYELYEWTAKLTPVQKEFLEIFRQGYKAYQDREFSLARDKFNIACNIDKNDILSKKYLDRCELYLSDPPPPEWDGVFRMTKK